MWERGRLEAIARGFVSSTDRLSDLVDLCSRNMMSSLRVSEFISTWWVCPYSKHPRCYMISYIYIFIYCKCHSLAERCSMVFGLKDLVPPHVRFGSRSGSTDGHSLSAKLQKQIACLMAAMLMDPLGFASCPSCVSIERSLFNLCINRMTTWVFMEMWRDAATRQMARTICKCLTTPQEKDVSQLPRVETPLVT